MGTKIKSILTALNPFASAKRLFRTVRKGKGTDVYFISGMCYNCKVFDKLTLPEGFRRIYLEWYVPRPDETLREYAGKMAKEINTRRPFILVGYSFGAVIMQEMDKFLKPEKCVIISSFKSRDEIPGLFNAVRRTGLAEKVTMKLYSATDFITTAFNKLVYETSNDELSEYMTVTDPVYIKWAVTQITGWIPDYQHRHLYHIHGTEDQVFPYDKIHRAFPVEGGDHLMVIKKADTVSSILDSILLMREED